MNSRQRIMTRWLGTMLVCAMCVSLPQTVLANIDDEAVMAKLMGMDFGQLGEVKVKLDDVFDVFDGLIKGRKVQVATGETQDMSRAPSVTTVITAQDIEAMGARDLDEILESVPGLHVGRSDIRYDPIYTIRGISSTNNPEVLLLINGISTNTLATGSSRIAWGGMPVNAIQRIEIIRGPGSAVYGADAFSGVINIVTKAMDDINGIETGLRLGSFNTKDVWVLVGKNVSGIDVAATLQYQKTDGQREIIESDAQAELDEVFGGMGASPVSLAPGSVNTQAANLDARLDLSKDKWRLRAGYQRRRDMGSGAGLGQSLDPTGRWQVDRLNMDVTYHNPVFTRFWDLTAQLSHYRVDWKPESDQHIYPAGAFLGSFPEGMIGNPGAAENNTRADLFGFYSGFKNHLVRTGIGYHYADLHKVYETKNFGAPDPRTGAPTYLGGLINTGNTPQGWLKSVDRTAWYMSLQDTWSIAANWELTAGIRYDDYSDFGSTVNPRGALVWQATPDFTAKLMYGRAFRAPNVVDQHGASNPVQLGSPEVKPEVIDTWEIAFDYFAMDNLHLATNVFHYKMTDKINFLVDPNTGIGTAANIATQKSSGFEFEARWKPTIRTSLLFNYAYQSSKDGEDNDVPNVPGQKAYVRGDWLMVPNWFLDARINWVADRKRPFSDTRPPLDDYVTVDLTVRFKDVKSDWNMAMGVRNVFDEDAREPAIFMNSTGTSASIANDLPQAGRNYFVEFRYRF